MSRNKRAEFNHACQRQGFFDTPCEADVLLEYDTGPSPEDFQLIDDEPISCEKGHVQTQRQLDLWYEDDFRDMGERMADAHESAYWDHINHQIDVARGK